MKKLIAILTLFFAISISASAQDKKLSVSSEKAKKEAAELSTYLGLDETQNLNFFRLFEQKHKILETPDLTVERKTELTRVIEAKIRASLDAESMNKLEKNPELFKKLLY